MRLVGRLTATALLAGSCVGLAATAATAAPPDNWGQEVKACNQVGCYPDDTNRGGYVSGQANDDQGPGYGFEIHRLAGPGRSDPHPFR